MRKLSAYERVLDHLTRIELGEPPPLAMMMADVEEELHDLYDEYAAVLDSGAVDRHSAEGRALSLLVTSLASTFEQLELLDEDARAAGEEPDT